MDTNENGKISKQESMKFIEAEFDRLDKGKNGGRQGTSTIEIARKPLHNCGEVTLGYFRIVPPDRGIH
jgi:hypothetical protein